MALNRLIAQALHQDAVGSSQIPDPTRDEGDVVEFVEPVSGTNDRYWLQQVTHPIVNGPMGLQGPKALPLFVS